METANKLTIETRVLLQQTYSFWTDVAIYFREIESRQEQYHQIGPVARIALIVTIVKSVNDIIVIFRNIIEV